MVAYAEKLPKAQIETVVEREGIDASDAAIAEAIRKRCVGWPEAGTKAAIRYGVSFQHRRQKLFQAVGAGPRMKPVRSSRHDVEMERHHYSLAVVAAQRGDYAAAAEHAEQAAKHVIGKPRLLAYYKKEAAKFRALSGQ